MNTLNTSMIFRGSESLARDTRLVCGLLEKLRGGLLEMRLPNGSSTLFGDGEHGVVMHVRDESVFSMVLARGDIGLAESYLDGHWDSPDITGLLALLARNRDVLKRAVYGSWHELLAARVRHWLNRNSRIGSKRNIMAHYDLGNDFYRLWLDPSMSYSAAIYRAGDDGSLEAAQHAKYRRILSRLKARPGQHVLEIGCGWGGFAEMAVAAGLQVSGITLSPAQLAWAEAGRQGDHPEHYHSRRPVRQLPQGDRLHPATRFPRRHAAIAPGFSRRRRAPGPGRPRRIRFRDRLRPDAGRVAPCFRGQVAANCRTRF